MVTSLVRLVAVVLLTVERHTLDVPTILAIKLGLVPMDQDKLVGQTILGIILVTKYRISWSASLEKRGNCRAF